jgi:hypothetical protein
VVAPPRLVGVFPEKLLLTISVFTFGETAKMAPPESPAELSVNEQDSTFSIDPQ